MSRHRSKLLGVKEIRCAGSVSRARIAAAWPRVRVRSPGEGAVGVGAVHHSGAVQRRHRRARIAQIDVRYGGSGVLLRQSDSGGGEDVPHRLGEIRPAAARAGVPVPQGGIGPQGAVQIEVIARIPGRVVVEEGDGPVPAGEQAVQPGADGGALGVGQGSLGAEGPVVVPLHQARPGDGVRCAGTPGAPGVRIGRGGLLLRQQPPLGYRSRLGCGGVRRPDGGRAHRQAQRQCQRQAGPFAHQTTPFRIIVREYSFLLLNYQRGAAAGAVPGRAEGAAPAGEFFRPQGEILQGQGGTDGGRFPAGVRGVGEYVAASGLQPGGGPGGPGSGLRRVRPRAGRAQSAGRTTGRTTGRTAGGRAGRRETPAKAILIVLFEGRNTIWIGLSGRFALSPE
jgi:hypothetical protein